MAEIKQDNAVSYFQIGGIHGQPYVRWNGEGGNVSVGAEVVGGTRFKGYCTHGSVLFPTWHRPYVSLFEVRQTDYFTYSMPLRTFIHTLSPFARRSSNRMRST